MLSDFSQAPDNGNARFDRIKVRLGEWCFRYDSDVSFREFCHALAKPPHSPKELSTFIEQTAIRGETEGKYGWIFGTPRHRGNKTAMKIRGRADQIPKDGTIEGFPLFGGELIIYKGHCSGEAFGHVDLFLNPSRYAFHQRPSSTIRTRARRLRFADEVSLTNNDNLLFGRDEIFFSGGDYFASLSRRYWKQTIFAIQQEIIRAASEGNVRSRFAPEFNLKEAEIYWEVENRAAVERVENLESILSLYAGKSETSFYPIGIKKGRVVNSRSLRVIVNSGLTLKCYAKTQRRIRFEFQYNLSQCCPLPDGRHTARGIGRFCEMLWALAEDAKERLSDVFSELDLDENQEGATILELLEEVQSATPDLRTANTISQLLLASGCLANSGFEEFAAIKRKLKRKRIVRSGPVRRGPLVLAERFMPLHRAFQRRLD